VGVQVSFLKSPSMWTWKSGVTWKNTFQTLLRQRLVTAAETKALVS
jgi:hypothetical protein